MRTYERYNTHFPVEVIQNQAHIEIERLASISYGGMRLDSDVPLPVGSVCDFRLPVINPKFHALGVIKWNRNAGDHYDIGVEFTQRDTEITEALVDQVYYIEEYFKEARRAGRHISIEDAADEWREEQRYM